MPKLLCICMYILKQSEGMPIKGKLDVTNQMSQPSPFVSSVSACINVMSTCLKCFNVHVFYISFFVVKIFTAGGFCEAMEEFIVPDLTEDVPKELSLFGGADTPQFDEVVHEPKGFRQRWLKRRRDVDEDVVPSPSLAQSEQVQPLIDAGPTSQPSAATNEDHTTSVTNAFLTGMKPSTITLPWEQPWLSPIFGDPFAAPSLSMPPDWNTEYINPLVDVLPGVEPPVPNLPSFTVARFIKNKVDRSFIDERAVQMDKAVSKMVCFLEIESECSGVGRQIMAENTEEGKKQVLLAVLGTRSPGTVIKRINALLHFYRWHVVNSDQDFLPLNEAAAWEYVRHLQLSGAAPTKAMSFVQALRFSHFILHVDGAESCFLSRRLSGSAELQMALKGPTRQARPLTVAEVRQLHAVTPDNAVDIQQRALAAHLLLMIYSRSRTSDLAHVHEILHDVSSAEDPKDKPGFIQISTRYHKSARSVEKKNMLLPILASSTGVTADDWLATWLRIRKKAGLPVAGQIGGAVQPAPDVNRKGFWMARPLGCSEITMLIRHFLKVDDRSVTSHSLKATTLSWAAKAEVPREQRRLLGRHSSSLQDSDSCYSRDLGFAPVKALQRVLLLIQQGEFFPDENRADFFKSSNPLVPGTPMPVFQPQTPAFLVREHEVATAEQLIEVQQPKMEESFIQVEDSLGPVEVEIFSSSDSTSSTSGCDDVESEVEQECELDGTRRPASEEVFSLDAAVKNVRSGIIHAVPDIGPAVTESVYANGELLQKKTTKCW